MFALLRFFFFFSFISVCQGGGCIVGKYGKGDNIC